MNNVVYVFKCTDSTLVVKGKVNSIFLDSCKKTAVVFDSVVSSIEFVNCQSVQMQVLGMVPTITIDKTDGCQMYLSQDSMNVEIVSSKSSEMNVLVPTGTGDFVSFPSKSLRLKSITLICSYSSNLLLPFLNFPVGCFQNIYLALARFQSFSINVIISLCFCGNRFSGNLYYILMLLFKGSRRSFRSILICFLLFSFYFVRRYYSFTKAVWGG